MNPISPALATAREQRRRTNGHFGHRLYGDPGVVEPVGSSSVPVEELLADGTLRWAVDGTPSRLDGPAVIRPDGTEEWRVDGELHREGGPALVSPDGLEMSFYRRGLLHNDNGPAVILANGRVEYWRDGRLHCDDNPAVIREDGTEEWWLDGVPGYPAEGDFAPVLIA
jgi:hypothetical protein